MADLPNERQINEAVCIDTKRIYDSCVSKDCLEDLRVTFFSRSQRLIDDAVTVKCRECEITSVSIDVEEVPFNRGYYSVDITFYFRLSFDTYSAPCTTPEVAVGFTQFTKKNVYSTAQTAMSKSSHQIRLMKSLTALMHRSIPTRQLRFRPLIPLSFPAMLLMPVTAAFRFAHPSLRAS